MRRALLACLLAATFAEPIRADEYYHPDGMDAWDFWYARSGDLFYAYYLQSPIDAPVRFSYPTIGLALSYDLIHWTEYGEMLRANPPGQWNDAWVATGSTWWHHDRWNMLFTGQTFTGSRGIGLATSRNLAYWTRVDSGPVQLNYQGFVVPVSPYWQGKGFPPGLHLRYHVLADPYVHPEPIDGWFYMVISSLLDGFSSPERGCISLWRSQDARVWEDVGLVAAPREYNEMEAPQIWKHGDRWYLIFGASRPDPVYRATMVYSSASMEGPYEPIRNPEVELPDYPGWFYVAKVVTNAQGNDVLLGGIGGRLSRPYLLTYEADSSITLTADRNPPAPPRSVSGRRRGPSLAHLSWPSSPENDVAYYRVYRGNDPSFTMSSQTRIGQPKAPAWDDPLFVPDRTHYKITVVDRIGNESAAVLVPPGGIIGTPEPRPTRTFLEPPTPNPLKGSTTMEYGLARDAVVSLRVYDLAGRRVRSLVEGPVPAGRWRASWDGRGERGRLPAGVYLIRLIAGDLEQIQKVVLH